MARKPKITPQKQKAQAEREARLAEALRANLRRRKDQKQGQKHAGEEGDTPTPEGQQKGET